MLNKETDDDNIIINVDNNSHICIIMTGDEKIYPFYMDTIDINRRYCEKKGYDFMSVIGRLLDKKDYMPHYDRYRLALDLMEKGKYKYILYIDSDAYIQDKNKKIEDFIGMMSNDDILLGSWDCGNNNRSLPINSGVLLFKNCDKSRQLCRDILTEHPECYKEKCECNKVKTKFFDQCVIDRLVKYHKYIKLIPYGILQIFDKNIGKCTGKIDLTLGSFIFHGAGINDKLRRELVKKNKILSNISNTKISVFILNYNRPHNVEKQLQNFLSEHFDDIIDEIVISNGHPDHIINKEDFKMFRNYEKIKIHNSFAINREIGAAKRFKIAAENCSNEFILNLDDDILPSRELILKLIYRIKKNPNNIYGPITRRCDEKGYKGYSNNYEDYNMVLTPILMVSKSTLKDYMKNTFHKFLSWFKKYKGNGEDLSLNLHILNKGIKPQYVNGKWEHLDNKNGYSSNKNHGNIRKNFCMKFFNILN